MNNNGGAEMVTDNHIGEIRTRFAKIWLGEDGIVQMDIFTKAEYTLGDIRESLEGIGKVSKGQRRPLLVDARNVRSIDFAARQEAASYETATSVAILIDSPVSQFIGTVFMTLNKRAHPIRTLYFQSRSHPVVKGFLE